MRWPRRPRTPEGVPARWIAALALLAIGVGGACALAGADAAASAVWSIAVAVALVALAATVVRALLRGRVGVDVIALLAMAGALAVGECSPVP